MFIRLLVLAAVIATVHVGDASLSAGRSGASGPIFEAPGITARAFARDDLRAALVTVTNEERTRLDRADADGVTRIYERAAGDLVWLDRFGRMTTQARDARSLLDNAASEGLDPADYRASDIAALADGLGDPAIASAEQAARLDVLLTAGVLRYFRHIHLGRVDPRALGLQITVVDDEHDFAELLWSAIDNTRVAETARELAPPISQYRLLRSALERYRALAAENDIEMTFSGTLRPGDSFADLPALRSLLVTVGDLAADTPEVEPSGIYDDAIRAGVVRFQTRHGLDADGVIGRTTQAALQVPLSWRARQIELTLERLRWLPDLSRGRLIAVNIPMFRLWAWDHVPSDDPPVLTMDVIVGRALDTRTPVFTDQMEYVVFRPYWNVPASILRNEMIPAIKRDTGYLERQNLEIVRGQGDNSPVLAPTLEHIAELGRGGVRIRQRPGPANALGLIKFMFPNQNDVYMHDTPATQLFSRSRRDFSHGCIRVEDPARLAEWVVGHDPAWTRDRIVAAMNGTPNRRVDLPEPIQVVIYYTTAIVQPEDDAVYFADDVYGHDAKLDKAL